VHRGSGAFYSVTDEPAEHAAAKTSSAAISLLHRARDWLSSFR